MKDIQFRKVNAEDVDILFRNLRPEDLRECTAMGFRPDMVLSDAVSQSVLCWSVYVEGELACIFGVGCDDDTPDIGVPWLLGTPAMSRIPRTTFMRHSQMFFQTMYERFPYLTNFILADFDRRIAWLRRLGFDVSSEPVRMGPLGEKFVLFEYGRN